MTTSQATRNAATTYTRVAGAAFLSYIAIGISQMALFGGITSGDGIAAKLATMAQHATEVRIDSVFSLATCFAALSLAVTLYLITREHGHGLALTILVCRVAEGLVGAVTIPVTLGLLTFATTPAGVAPTSEESLAFASAIFAGQAWTSTIAALFFAVGSGAFCWLLVRGRMIPAALAWIGVVASILLVVALPLRIVGVMPGSVMTAIWALMALFEIPLGVWLIIKGINVGEAYRPATEPA